MNNKEIWDLLISKAIEVQNHRIISPFIEGGQVGAAILTKAGNIYTGVCIDTASSLGICAERNAIFHAVGLGEKKIVAIAIVGGKDGKITDYCAPCGICRQVMREFCSVDDFIVIVAKSTADYQKYRLKELLPCSFGPEDLS